MAKNPKRARTPRPKEPFEAHVNTFMQRLDRFWQRVTEGMQLGQLWSQFSADARSSYQLYSKEVDSKRVLECPKENTP
jgi:hypothetical protein